jgi:hypothetical protein
MCVYKKIHYEYSMVVVYVSFSMAAGRIDYLQAEEKLFQEPLQYIFQLRPYKPMFCRPTPHLSCACSIVWSNQAQDKLI